MNEEFYIAIICEVFNGYTPFRLGDRTVYLSHLTLLDQQELDIHYQNYYRQAIEKGVPIYKDSLSFQIEEGLWTELDDKKIAASKDELARLKNTKQSLPLPSQKKSVQDRIDEVHSEIVNAERKKAELIGITAEDYATNRAHEKLLYSCFFKNKELTDLLFTQEEFDDLEVTELNEVSMLRVDLANRMSDKNLQEAVLRPFFSLYIPLCDDNHSFYGKPVTKLTIQQLKLTSFGRMFYNIFQYTDDIPDDIRQDPEKLISFADMQKNKDKGRSMLKDDAAGSMVFGATKEDIKDLRGGDGAVSLTDALKEKGGKLNMEDLMKLSGE